LPGLVLCLYGVVPTLQPAHFGRVYQPTVGFFIVLFLLWGWIFDGNQPDRFDVIGATVSLVGVSSSCTGQHDRGHKAAFILLSLQ
jgi:small multidrug resistance family-3 protein